MTTSTDGRVTVSTWPEPVDPHSIFGSIKIREHKLAAARRASKAPSTGWTPPAAPRPKVERVPNPHTYDTTAYYTHEAQQDAAQMATMVIQSSQDKLRAKMLDLKGLRAMPPAVPLIKDVLDRNSLTWLIGQPGGFKSFVAIDWACHVALGRPWRGQPVKAGKVLYVVAEGATGFRKRVEAWIKVNGVEPEDLTILPVAVQAAGDRGETSGQWGALVEIVREDEFALVVLDTQARMTAGLEENSATEMNVWVKAVDAVRTASEACVLVVHHTGRNGQDARGSSAIDGAQDMEWKVERKAHQLSAVLKCEKSKDGDDRGRYSFAMEVIEIGKDEDGQDVTSLVLGQEEQAQSRGMIDVYARIVEEGESLTRTAYVQRTVELGEVDGTGLTITEAFTLLSAQLKEAGRDPISRDTFRALLNRLVKDGELFRIGQRYTAVDPSAEPAIEDDDSLF